MPRIRITTLPGPSRPRVVAVLLHGGRAQQPRPVPLIDASYLRMLPFAWRLRQERDLRVVLLHNPAGGWGGRRGAGIEEGSDALAEIAARWPEVPLILVGHSSGGWASLLLGDRPGVRGVCALAPWIDGSVPWRQLLGVKVRVVHGDRDRVTSPRRSASYVARLAAAGGDATCEVVPDAGHAMLERPGWWHERVVALVREIAEE